MLLSFGDHEYSCREHPVPVFVWLHLWINTKECECWTVWPEYVSFGKKLSERLHHRASPPAVTESCRCSTSSSAFDAVSVLGLGHSNRCVTASASALVCISLMTYDVEHLFRPLFAICVSSLVTCLSLAHF